MLRTITCLQISVIWCFLSTINCYAQSYLDHSENFKFSYLVDKNNINQDTSIEQPIVFPIYKVDLSTTNSLTTCASVECSKAANKADHAYHSWGGLFNEFDSFNEDLSVSEVAFLLANNIKGLDPLLSHKIVQLGILKKIKFKKRPKNWNKFVSFITKIQNELDNNKITYNLYASVINLHGFENATRLNYFIENSCSKLVFDCVVNDLSARKQLIRKVEKNITVRYLKPSTSSNAFLYNEEIDKIDIVLSQFDLKPEIIKDALHNTYSVKLDAASNNEHIIVNITPIKRKKFQLPDNFIYIHTDNFAKGIFFEWRLGSYSFDSMIKNEKHNISIDYKICKIFSGVCIKTIRKGKFNLNSINIPERIARKELMLYKHTLGFESLEPFRIYRLNYRINVENSDGISSPSNNAQQIDLQFIPYDN